MGLVHWCIIHLEAMLSALRVRQGLPVRNNAALCIRMGNSWASRIQGGLIRLRAIRCLPVYLPIAAMILGMILGFTAVFFIAAACYAVRLLAIRMTAKRPARNREPEPGREQLT
jgi:hypothetical protein